MSARYEPSMREPLQIVMGGDVLKVAANVCHFWGRENHLCNKQWL